ncbi:glutamate--tRNA ligase [Pajaroellobacter abortibovis]|uniref:glutamate--tRNA ligase n=1 Tax=Pajaroellobacter abortibovis TaxID=1882918 RepID=UPI001FE9EA4C|nr:glutamate--tRNA ligase [Pajaroellobacter abortibovis]
MRFAPSPTGYLHIGCIRTCLFNWLWARKTGGVFVLRIEDSDRERSTQESVGMILDSLRWLGLTWDEGLDVGGVYGPYVQMDRLDIYRAWGERLVQEGKAYRCYCTKEELDAQRAAFKASHPKAHFKYPGTCRARTDHPSLPYVLRFKTPTEGVTTYIDQVFGEIQTPNSVQQDFVLIRADGIPLYNFGAVVDDITMEITLVARGRDHLVNTPSQILLYEAFGAPVPKFAHLPMLLAPNGEKLSKRHGAVSVTEYRERGYSPTALLNYLVRFGWSHGDQEVFSRQELIELFDWKGCRRADGRFDAQKLLAINHEHLKTERLTDAAAYQQSVIPFLEKRGLPQTAIASDTLEKGIPTIRERARTYEEAAEALDFYLRKSPIMDGEAVEKYLVPASNALFRSFLAVLEGIEPWSEQELEQRVRQWLEEQRKSMKEIAQPVRVALTGSSASPGLFEVLSILGKKESMNRLERGLTFSQAP